MLRVRLKKILTDLCKMFNSVRILVYCAKICSKRSDSAIDLVKTNKRQAQATSSSDKRGIKGLLVN